LISTTEFVILIVASFFSSAWTAVIGKGGGIFLISILSGVLPPEAIIPVHGVVQFFSNVSRAAFGLRDANWQLAGPFLLGAVLGAVVGTPVFEIFPTDYLPLILGLFVLLLIWVPGVLKRVKLPGGFFTLGAVETFMSLFVGFAGPISAPFLIKEGLNKDEIVVTGAVISLIAHGLKIVAFVVLGFAFGAYLPLMGAMIVAVTLGSYAGTQVRQHVSEELFLVLFKVIVSVLAVRMILASLELI